jgi:ankyrin repeat domain-containing protein 17
VDVNQTSERIKSTPAIIAVEAGNLIILEYLVSQNADLSKRKLGDKTPFLLACEYGHLEVVKYLFEKADDPAAIINEVDGCDQSPLYMAAANGHLNIVEFLAENGANLEQKTCLKDEDKIKINTPLLVSKKNNRQDVVKYLRMKIQEAEKFSKEID